MVSSFALLSLGVALLANTASAESVVLVTGATGRTGALLYKALRAKGYNTRGLVRNVTLAREKLGCVKCDNEEGIFVGDVTQPSTLAEAFVGVDLLAIAVGIGGGADKSTTEKVEFLGVKAQVEALMKSGFTGKRVLLISSMSTTNPPEAKSNDLFFYKLNAEAFIEASGVPYAIVKPCGLSEDTAGQRELLSSPDSDAESWFSDGFYMIPRGDVAEVAAAALTKPLASGMRFDLCAKKAGSGKGDIEKALKSALWPWQEQEAEVYA